MNLQIRSSGVPLNAHLASYLERRIRRTLDDSGEVVHSAHVDLRPVSDETASELFCSIHLHLDCGDLVVESRGGNPIEAVEGATRQVGVILSDYLGRLGLSRGHLGVSNPGAA